MGETVKNMQVILKNYVTEGFPKESDFDIIYTDINLKLLEVSNSILFQTLYLSCDPVMRFFMSKPSAIVLSTYTPGSVIYGYGVAEVLESTHSAYQKGDLVWGTLNWEQYSIVNNPKDLIKIDPKHDVPLSYYTGILGMPGVAAYFGFHDMCSPMVGEKVYVSSACGGIGQLVGQFAKLMGCYVVGSAGSKEKIEKVKNMFKFDDAFNYNEVDVDAALKRYFPNNSIDIYFDNVGGETLDAVLLNTKRRARIAACGMISQYNVETKYGIKNLLNVTLQWIRLEGFVVDDYFRRYDEFLEKMLSLIKEKKIAYLEDTADGLEKGLSALIGIFHGCNVGKQVVAVCKK